MWPPLLNQGDQRTSNRERLPFNLARARTSAEDLPCAAEPELRFIECGECVTTTGISQT
jgi:hypothetical protein